jgi:hypothetical protein
MSKKVIILPLLAGLFFLSMRLDKSLPDKPVLSKEMSVANFSMFAATSLFEINRFMVGYLWLRFDMDSTNSTQNYHRLLPTLEMIVSIKPDEFVAYGLMTYMRLVRYGHENNLKEMDAVMQRLVAAAGEFPQNWRGQYEVAFMYGIFFKDFEKALPYAERAWEMGQNKESFLLLDYIKKALAILSVEDDGKLLKIRESDGLSVDALKELKILAPDDK